MLLALALVRTRTREREENTHFVSYDNHGAPGTRERGVRPEAEAKHTANKAPPAPGRVSTV